jgi:hypothetical protein
MSMPAARHRFTLDDWHQMIETGVFRKGPRLELLDGEIYDMVPIGPFHVSVVDRLNRFWVTTLGTRAIVRVQGSVPAPPQSQPEPDLVLLRERQDFYRVGHPRPDDVLLIIEVADRSLAYDHDKLRIYARASMREVWIVDLLGESIEIYRAPRGDEYRDVRAARRGESVACLAFPDVTLAVDDVLG